METDRYDLGQEWYAKAIERGASERSIDSDLRSIYSACQKTKNPI